MKKFNKSTFDVEGFEALQKRIADINNISIPKQKRFLYELRSLSKTSSLQPSESSFWPYTFYMCIFFGFSLTAIGVVEPLIAYLVFIIFVGGGLFLAYLSFRELKRYFRYKKYYKKTYEEYVRSVKEIIEHGELIINSVLTLRGDAIRNQIRPILESEFPESEFAIETLLDKIYPKEEGNLSRHL